MARRTEWGATTWYVIASHSTARIIEHVRGRPRLRIVSELPVQDDAPAAELLAELMRPRHFEPASGHARQLERDTFVAELASELRRYRDRGAFDRLVLVGPSAVLRRLHSAMDPGTRTMVSEELAQDLSMLPVTGLQRRLGELLRS